MLRVSDETPAQADAGLHVQLGNVNVQLGDLGGALGSYEAAAKLGTLDPAQTCNVLASIGVLLLDRGEPDQALQQLEAARRIHNDTGPLPEPLRTPAGVELLLYVGTCKLALGDLAGALDAYEKGHGFLNKVNVACRKDLIAALAAVRAANGDQAAARESHHLLKQVDVHGQAGPKCGFAAVKSRCLNAVVRKALPPVVPP
jgi:tetratricopeptide (TPR) repeat protein